MLLVFLVLGNKLRQIEMTRALDFATSSKAIYVGTVADAFSTFEANELTECMASVEPVFHHRAEFIMIGPQFTAAFLRLCHEIGHENIQPLQRACDLVRDRECRFRFECF